MFSGFSVRIPGEGRDPAGRLTGTTKGKLYKKGLVQSPARW